MKIRIELILLGFILGFAGVKVFLYERRPPVPTIKHLTDFMGEKLITVDCPHGWTAKFNDEWHKDYSADIAAKSTHCERATEKEKEDAEQGSADVYNQIIIQQRREIYGTQD